MMNNFLICQHPDLSLFAFLSHEEIYLAKNVGQKIYFFQKLNQNSKVPKEIITTYKQLLLILLISNNAWYKTIALKFFYI